MPSLLEKIESNAASRLTFPDGQPTQELNRYKDFLKVENHRLKILHRAGAEGREICHARSAVMDILLGHLIKAVDPHLGRKERHLALVALGGYGRKELNPFSDIDVMFLHDAKVDSQGKPNEELARITERALYMLWDIGLKVGHSVRNLNDCVRMANEDTNSKTSMIEARLLAGDAGLFQNFQRSILKKAVSGHEDEYIASRLTDQQARRAKFGNSPLMQEPNVKNGCGSLRDYQNLLWMAFFKYQIRSLHELEARRQISSSERKQLDTAYDFLLRVRTELHYFVNRPVDVLFRNLQPSIAYNLGYTDPSPVRRLEKFMGDYYNHSRNLYLITRTLEQRLALLPQPRRWPTFREVISSRRNAVSEQRFDGFKGFRGEIYPGSPRVFRDQPRRMMRVFLHAQKRGLLIHPDLAQLIRNQLHLVDKRFIRDPHVHGTFLEILSHRGNVAPILRDMHEVGFLGKFLPEFGRLTCLVQHEFYHQYTADEHTLVCLEKLDEIWDARKAPYSNYTELLQSVEQPSILYLALLLHDAGKGGRSKKNHSVTGAQLARRVAERLNLHQHAEETLALLIENHLLLAQISQRRDLDDRTVIHNVANHVKTPENLMLLMLITFADSQGTSSNLWNDFKETLLWQLYYRTRDFLTGTSEFIQAEEKEREQLLEEVRAKCPQFIREDELQAHVATLPQRYFQIHPPQEICADLKLVHRFFQLQSSDQGNPLEPIVSWYNEPDRGYSTLKVCTWNRAGLFSKVAGSLTASMLNILSAQIFSRGDGVVIDKFFVVDAETGRLAIREERQKFTELFKTALVDHVDFPSLIRGATKRSTDYQALGGDRLTTTIHFDNEISETRTVIEVIAEDRIGLLFTISKTLSELSLDISVAKIITEKGAAIDSFYVAELDGSKIWDPERRHAIETALRDAINDWDLTDSQSVQGSPRQSQGVSCDSN